MISLLEIAWIAGLLEGEGSFLYNNGLTIRLVMTDKDVVERAASVIGIKKIYENARDLKNVKHKRAYILCVNGYRAAAWMLTIYSFMGQRRQKKIRENIAQWKKMRLVPRTMNGEQQFKTYATCHPNRLRYAGTLCEQCAKYKYHINYKRKHDQKLSDYNIRYKRKHRQAIRRCAGTVDLFQ